ncbi:MAG: chorismate synthase [Coriobacteriia bacterium]|nr:chorismate synthase [Coriobacteriia bacterium]
MRYVTAGESHGRALAAIIEDVPAGIAVDTALIDRDLARRQAGYGRGGRQRIESDRVTVLSGIRFGTTIGSPVCLTVANRDWDNWLDVMASSGIKPVGIAETAPRPGHADLPGALRIGTDDVRDVLERASARETAARVAAGGIAKALLTHLGVSVGSYVQAIGRCSADIDPAAITGDVAEAVEASNVRCPDGTASARMRTEIDRACADGESLGGIFVVTANGLVPGLGGYAQAGSRLDAALGPAMFSIPAVKGVEIGDGFCSAALPGSAVHDEIRYGRQRGFWRPTNRAGGVEGGMTNGEQLVVRCAMKPVPTLARPLGSVDILTHGPVDASRERSDVCAVPAAAVVAEAEVAFVLARAYLDAFGNTSVKDIVAALERYRSRVMP